MLWIPKSSVAPTEIVQRSDLNSFISSLIDLNVLYDFASDWYKYAQCIYKCKWWQFFYQLNVDLRSDEGEQHCSPRILDTPYSSASVFQGPNTSNPTFVNGGPGFNLPFGKSDIFDVREVHPHCTHLNISYDMSLFAPFIQ